MDRRIEAGRKRMCTLARDSGRHTIAAILTPGLGPSIPEDLYHLIKKAVVVRKHLERNRADKDAKLYVAQTPSIRPSTYPQPNDSHRVPYPPSRPILHQDPTGPPYLQVRGRHRFHPCRLNGWNRNWIWARAESRLLLRTCIDDQTLADTCLTTLEYLTLILPF